MAIYYVDLVTDHYVEFQSNHTIKRLSIAAHGDDFFSDVARDCERIIHPGDREAFIAAFDKLNLLHELRSTGQFSINYRLLVGEDKFIYSTVTVYVSTDNPDFLIVAVKNIDNEMRWKHELNKRMKRTETYNSIAKTLAKDYFTLYYVDLQTDEFSEYSSSHKYESIGIEKSGDDFFNSSKRNVAAYIHPDDVVVLQKAMEKENLLKEINDNGTFTIKYRIMVDNEPNYVSLKAMRMIDDDSHIIVAISDIDRQIKREQKRALELSEAKQMALQDKMTGVKNKNAFKYEESLYDERIAKKEQKPFAIVVCDVNGLKTINDNLGHDAGDEYIKDACHLICEHFPHSAVFRIGGDEFLTILHSNGDYERRDEILDSINKEVERRLKSGKGATISVGMSIYDPSEDESLNSVFKRADKLMYAHKSELKGLKE